MVVFGMIWLLFLALTSTDADLILLLLLVVEVEEDLVSVLDFVAFFLLLLVAVVAVFTFLSDGGDVLSSSMNK